MKLYKITNKINNMIYIGQTKNYLKRRFNAHCSKSSTCKVLNNAISKYGRTNFIIELIEETLCPVVIDWLEKKYIKQYNTMVPNGYNILAGGAGAYSELKGKHKTKRPSFFKGKKHSAESKLLMRQARLGKSPSNKGTKGMRVAWNKGLKLKGKI